MNCAKYNTKQVTEKHMHLIRSVSDVVTQNAETLSFITNEWNRKGLLHLFLAYVWTYACACIVLFYYTFEIL